MKTRDVCLLEPEGIERMILSSNLPYVRDHNDEVYFVIDLSKKDEILQKLTNIKKAYEDNNII